jgi:hypothetical protein
MLLLGHRAFDADGEGHGVAVLGKLGQIERQPAIGHGLRLARDALKRLLPGLRGLWGSLSQGLSSQKRHNRGGCACTKHKRAAVEH